MHSQPMMHPQLQKPAYRIHIWMNFPSHHQSGFFQQLLARGVDLQVTYYEAISADRIAQGWSGTASSAFETSLSELQCTAVQRLHMLRDYVHVIPGYGTQQLREIVAVACDGGYAWCHWSEPAHPGMRYWARWLTRRRYAMQVNRHALGAFAQGVMARNDFVRWGIHAEKIADLTYSTPAPEANAERDSRIVEFARGRAVFLFVGQQIQRKAVDVLLRAMATLNTNDWCLVCVGHCSDKRYENMARQLQLDNRVLFLPALHWRDISRVYRSADVLVLPSRFDGWGMVANEAAAHGKALILSDACGAAWHLLEPGINGYMVTAGSVRSLAAAMQNYVRGGQPLACHHGSESARIASAYSCARSVDRLLAALDSWSCREQGASRARH